MNGNISFGEIPLLQATNGDIAHTLSVFLPLYHKIVGNVYLSCLFICHLDTPTTETVYLSEGKNRYAKVCFHACCIYLWR